MRSPIDLKHKVVYGGPLYHRYLNQGGKFAGDGGVTYSRKNLHVGASCASSSRQRRRAQVNPFVSRSAKTARCQGAAADVVAKASCPRGDRRPRSHSCVNKAIKPRPQTTSSMAPSCAPGRGTALNTDSISVVMCGGNSCSEESGRPKYSACWSRPNSQGQDISRPTPSTQEDANFRSEPAMRPARQRKRSAFQNIPKSAICTGFPLTAERPSRAWTTSGVLPPKVVGLAWATSNGEPNDKSHCLLSHRLRVKYRGNGRRHRGEGTARPTTRGRESSSDESLRRSIVDDAQRKNGNRLGRRTWFDRERALCSARVGLSTPPCCDIRTIQAEYAGTTRRAGPAPGLSKHDVAFCVDSQTRTDGCNANNQVRYGGTQFLDEVQEDDTMCFGKCRVLADDDFICRKSR